MKAEIMNIAYPQILSVMQSADNDQTWYKVRKHDEIFLLLLDGSPYVLFQSCMMWCCGVHVIIVFKVVVQNIGYRDKCLLRE